MGESGGDGGVGVEVKLFIEEGELDELVVHF